MVLFLDTFSFQNDEAAVSGACALFTVNQQVSSKCLLFQYVYTQTIKVILIEYNMELLRCKIHTFFLVVRLHSVVVRC